MRYSATGIVWVKIDPIYIRLLALTEFEDILDRLVLDGKEWRTKVIASDYNAWPTERGISLTNARGDTYQ